VHDEAGAADPVGPEKARSTEEDPGPVGRGDHVVSNGECIYSIARDAGHLWQTIWNHPGNAELKRQRHDPGILLPGDRVFVPACQLKEESGATEQRHSFRKRGEKQTLTIHAYRFDEPMARQRYVLVFDKGARSFQGTTDADGRVKVPIRGNERSAKLIVGSDPDDQEIFELTLGGIDPIVEISGVQTRLINLGFGCDVSGTLDERTVAAISAFQSAVGLPVTGEPDEATRQRLKAEHRDEEA
jgi:putative peptidoglycan binding protein